MRRVQKVNFTNKEELITFLTDLQGQVANLQEMVDKLAPVEEAAEESTDPLAEEETPDAGEVDELDSLLQD